MSVGQKYAKIRQRYFVALLLPDDLEMNGSNLKKPGNRRYCLLVRVILVTYQHSLCAHQGGHLF